LTKFPKLSEPQRYQGLYAFDFGDWTAFGYTADEIALLLESEQYAAGKVYRIHRAYPDGRFELKGVASERFKLESGMFFCCRDLEAARRDFDALCLAADRSPPPTRAFLHMAERTGAEAAARYVVALVYPAEYEEDMSHWLLAMDYAGGDLAEGGISQVAQYYEAEKTILERRQLWSAASLESRRREQVYSSVRQVAQR
jgi:hypothetical protein